MAGYLLQKVDGSSWQLVDERSGEAVGRLERHSEGFRAKSTNGKMQAEAVDPWLILRLVFNTEDLQVAMDGGGRERLTEANAALLLV